MIPSTLQAHVQTLGDSSIPTKDPSQCRPDCIVIDSSECSPACSTAPDCASSKPVPTGNVQEPADRNSVPRNANPPLRASKSSGQSRGRVGRPRSSSGTSARPISVDSPKDSTSTDRPLEPTSSETPRNTTSTPPRRRKARQNSLWYLRYKSESPDPITQKYFCKGCPPGREYKYVNNSQLSRHATQHRFTGDRRRYHCFGCKDERKFCRMDALQRHMVKGEMYKECLERGLYSEYDEFGNGVLIEHPIPKQWRKPDPQKMDIDD
ncbi:hypothetical protein BGZ80_005124 [Entomortierella chlamydospora]|uniref:Uncharacterized protein n=1 Tax=Entomortierella chlamydospora TaxID=101097 RepID=A0A9P6MKU9_9FUNG|nr:hypothetical protein BGZ80_005124 [Entomortierella chlamydospora]